MDQSDQNTIGLIRRKRSNSGKSHFDALFSKLSLSQLLALQSNVENILARNSNGANVATNAVGADVKANVMASASPSSSFTEMMSLSSVASPDTALDAEEYWAPPQPELSEFLELAAIEDVPDVQDSQDVQNCVQKDCYQNSMQDL